MSKEFVDISVTGTARINHAAVTNLSATNFSAANQSFRNCSVGTLSVSGNANLGALGVSGDCAVTGVLSASETHAGALSASCATIALADETATFAVTRFGKKLLSVCSDGRICAPAGIAARCAQAGILTAGDVPLSAALPWSQAIIRGYADTNGHAQVNIVNKSAGKRASADVVATNDAGDDSAGYVCMGINGSGFAPSEDWSVNGAGDAYLYSRSGGLAVGTRATDGELRFFSGGSSLEDNLRMTIGGNNAASGYVRIAGDLTAAKVLATEMNVGAAPATGPPMSSAIVRARGSAPNYLQINVANSMAGRKSSSDIVATADCGTDVANYINMGINSSAWDSQTWTVNGALDGYLYCAGGNLAVGTSANGKIIDFMTGGTLASNRRARIDDGGLSVAGALRAANVATKSIMVDAGAGAVDGALIDASTTYAGSADIYAMNYSSAPTADGGFTAVCDDGLEEVHYAKFGVTSSKYNVPAWNICGPHDAFLFASGAGVRIGATGANDTVSLFAGGSTLGAEVANISGARMRILRPVVADASISAVGAVSCAGLIAAEGGVAPQTSANTMLAVDQIRQLGARAIIASSQPTITPLIIDVGARHAADLLKINRANATRFAVTSATDVTSKTSAPTVVGGGLGVDGKISAATLSLDGASGSALITASGANNSGAVTIRARNTSETQLACAEFLAESADGASSAALGAKSAAGGRECYLAARGARLALASTAANAPEISFALGSTPAMSLTKAGVSVNSAMTVSGLLSAGGGLMIAGPITMNRSSLTVGGFAEIHGALNALNVVNSAGDVVSGGDVVAAGGVRAKKISAGGVSISALEAPASGAALAVSGGALRILNGGGAAMLAVTAEKTVAAGDFVARSVECREKIVARGATFDGDVLVNAGANVAGSLKVKNSLAVGGDLSASAAEIGAARCGAIVVPGVAAFHPESGSTIAGSLAIGANLNVGGSIGCSAMNCVKFTAESISLDSLAVGGATKINGDLTAKAVSAESLTSTGAITSASAISAANIVCAGAAEIAGVCNCRGSIFSKGAGSFMGGIVTPANAEIGGAVKAADGFSSKNFACGRADDASATVPSIGADNLGGTSELLRVPGCGDSWIFEANGRQCARIAGDCENGAFVINHSTPSVSPHTGALVVIGGVGVGGDLHAAGSLNAASARVAGEIGAENANFASASAGAISADGATIAVAMIDSAKIKTLDADSCNILGGLQATAATIDRTTVGTLTATTSISTAAMSATSATVGNLTVSGTLDANSVKLNTSNLSVPTVAANAAVISAALTADSVAARTISAQSAEIAGLVFARNVHKQMRAIFSSAELTEECAGVILSKAADNCAITLPADPRDGWSVEIINRGLGDIAVAGETIGYLGAAAVSYFGGDWFVEPTSAGRASTAAWVARYDSQEMKCEVILARSGRIISAQIAATPAGVPVTISPTISSRAIAPAHAPLAILAGGGAQVVVESDGAFSVTGAATPISFQYLAASI